MCRAALVCADLRGAVLDDVDFSGARFHGARLQGADLRRAGLGSADLMFARYDERTQWPAGIDPQARGARLPRQVRPSPGYS
jgi:uncharacterized protein YjbI with pentapeptide repeats